MNSKIVEYAKLAEKYEVEFFASMNEPEVLFGPSASAIWGQEILPKIREVYHGKVIWKGGGPMNLSGYDYIGFTISKLVRHRRSNKCHVGAGKLK